MIVPTWMCTYMQCPDTLVPQDELWPDTSMSLVNNNIIMIVSTRLIGENTSMCMFNCCWRSEVKCDYLTTVKQSWTSSIPTGIFRYFIITCLDTNVHVSAQTWLWPHDLGTNMCGHNRVWAQSCGLNHVWAQSCGVRNTCQLSFGLRLALGFVVLSLCGHPKKDCKKEDRRKREPSPQMNSSG